MSLNQFVKNTKSWTKQHSPEILVTAGIGYFIASAVLAVPATVKALDLIDEEKDRRLSEWPVATITKDQEHELLSMKPVEYVKICWKVYSPSALLLFLGGICVVNANRVNIKRTAALTAVYTMSETALREFKNKAVEVVGENKVEEIKKEIVQDKVFKNPPVQNNIIIAGKGETLCLEGMLTGQYIKINLDLIQKIENEINLVLRSQDYCGFNTYLDRLGIPHTDVSGRLGWNINRDGYIKIERIPALTPDGEPCICLEINAIPAYEYDRYY